MPIKTLMKISNIRVLVLSFLVGIGTLLIPVSAYAASAQDAGISVAPAQLEFNVDSNISTQTKTIEISNSYDVSQRLSAEFQAIDETGARLVPNGALESSFAKTLKLSATDIVVPAKSKYTLQIAVDGSSLKGGGHYASLVLTQRSNSVLPQGYRSAIAINLFVIKDENIRTNLMLTGSTFGNTLFSMPSTATLTFRNLGNTHVVPRASVSVYDKEELVSKAVVNQSSAPLFPNQQSSFTGKFDSYKTILIPKKLRSIVVYRIDGSDIQLTSESTFWHVPLIPIAVIVSLVVALFVWRRKLWLAMKKAKNHLFSWSRRSRPRPKSSIEPSSTPASVTQTVPPQELEKHSNTFIEPAQSPDTELERKVAEMMEQERQPQPVQHTTQPTEQHAEPAPVLAPASRSISITFAEEPTATIESDEQKVEAPKALAKKAPKSTTKSTKKPSKSSKKPTKKSKTTKTK